MKPGTSQKPARAVTLSIFVRCALLIAVATFTVVAVMAMESSKLVREVAVAGVADRAASVNRFLSSQTSGGIRFGKEDAILGVLTSASEMSDGYMSSGLAADRDGTVLATLGADAASARELADLAAAAVETGDRVASPDGLLQADPVVFGPEREVIGAVATAWSADPILASLRDSTMMILAVAGTVFVIALAGSVFVLRKTIAVPLRRVGTAMKAVVGGDLEHTIPETARRDEIGLMARDLEEFRGIMSGVAEAERSREEMRAAQAEVVEALRTGLASLRDGDQS